MSDLAHIQIDVHEDGEVSWVLPEVSDNQREVVAITRALAETYAAWIRKITRAKTLP